MTPLTVANIGDEIVIKKVGGLPETKHHLEALGFAEGTVVRVISKLNDNFIVAVKEVRIALDDEMASKIYF